MPWSTAKRCLSLQSFVCSLVRWSGYGWNGITAATLIKRVDDFEDVPIIAVTAYGKEYIDEAEAYGFDEVIEKPFVIDEIHEVLDHYLGAVDS